MDTCLCVVYAQVGWEAVASVAVRAFFVYQAPVEYPK